MGEALVLTLDGSTAVCSAALLRLADASGAQPAWETVARRDEADGRAQARVLLRSIDEMLRETGSRASDLRAIVVGVGPGTFTGVRITVATARAAALALDIPVLGVSTLAGVAAAVVAAAVVVFSSPPVHADSMHKIIKMERSAHKDFFMRYETSF